MLSANVRNDDPTGTDWSAREIDRIVADYFDMKGLLASGPVSFHRRELSACPERPSRVARYPGPRHRDHWLVLPRCALSRLLELERPAIPDVVTDGISH
jgi:hypothetical protein